MQWADDFAKQDPGEQRGHYRLQQQPNGRKSCGQVGHGPGDQALADDLCKKRDADQFEPARIASAAGCVRSEAQAIGNSRIAITVLLQAIMLAVGTCARRRETES